MKAKRYLTVALAVLGCLWGLGEFLRSPRVPRVPAWGRHLAGLHTLPLVPGDRVGLVVPATIAGEARQRLLMEASWLRPEVLWELDGAPAAGLESLVLLLQAPPPPNWRIVAVRGQVALARPNRPPG